MLRVGAETAVRRLECRVQIVGIGGAPPIFKNPAAADADERGFLRQPVLPGDLVAPEGQGSLKLDAGFARSRWDSLIGSGRNLSVSRVGQESESGDSRSHGSDAFDEGASPWDNGSVFLFQFCWSDMFFVRALLFRWVPASRGARCGEIAIIQSTVVSLVRRSLHLNRDCYAGPLSGYFT